MNKLNQSLKVELVKLKNQNDVCMYYRCIMYVLQENGYTDFYVLYI